MLYFLSVTLNTISTSSPTVIVPSKAVGGFMPKFVILIFLAPLNLMVPSAFTFPFTKISTLLVTPAMVTFQVAVILAPSGLFSILALISLSTILAWASAFKAS